MFKILFVLQGFLIVLSLAQIGEVDERGSTKFPKQYGYRGYQSFNKNTVANNLRGGNKYGNSNSNSNSDSDSNNNDNDNDSGNSGASSHSKPSGNPYSTIGRLRPVRPAGGGGGGGGGDLSSSESAFWRGLGNALFPWTGIGGFRGFNGWGNLGGFGLGGFGLNGLGFGGHRGGLGFFF